MNYRDLINISFKKPRFILLLISLIIIIGVWSFNQEITDVYNTLGYVKDNYLVLNIPISVPDTISHMEKIKIDNQQYNLDIESVSEIMLDQNSLVNYQEVRLKATDFIENQVVKITIYYNKEKVLEKLKKVIF